MRRPKGGWQVFFLTTIVGFAFLRPRWRLWYWPVIVVDSWHAADGD